MPKEEKSEIIEVEPMDPNKKNSPVMEGPEPEDIDQRDAYCWWNGQRYSACSTVIQAGKKKHCSGGKWWDA